MLLFKEGVLEGGSNTLSVAPTVDSIKAAVAQSREGALIRPDLASGAIVFDDDGDRREQPYSVLVPEEDGGSYRWATVSTYSSDGDCQMGCN